MRRRLPNSERKRRRRVGGRVVSDLDQTSEGSLWVAAGGLQQRRWSRIALRSDQGERATVAATSLQFSPTIPRICKY